MLLFQPLTENDSVKPWVKVIDALNKQELSEAQYFENIRQIYNRRNPHVAVGDDMLDLDADDTTTTAS